MATWNRTLNDAVVRWHRDAGHDVPDLNELDAQGINLTFFHGFPHFFVLPMYSSASAYRFRPLGPEETLMEIWSLARFTEGDEPRHPLRPKCGSATIRGGRRSPRRTSPTSRASRRVSTRKGFEYMRLSAGLEGHISNFQRTVDGFLAGLPYEQLLPGAGVGQRVPVGAADPRPRLLNALDLRGRLIHCPVSHGVRNPRGSESSVHSIDELRHDVARRIAPPRASPSPGQPHTR